MILTVNYSQPVYLVKRDKIGEVDVVCNVNDLNLFVLDIMKSGNKIVVKQYIQGKFRYVPKGMVYRILRENK